MANPFPSTKRFKKAFNMTNLTAKMSITEKLAGYVQERKFPGGRPMDYKEYRNLVDLLEWCNQNTFFDITESRYEPKYDL